MIPRSLKTIQLFLVFLIASCTGGEEADNGLISNQQQTVQESSPPSTTDNTQAETELSSQSQGINQQSEPEQIPTTESPEPTSEDPRPVPAALQVEVGVEMEEEPQEPTTPAAAPPLPDETPATCESPRFPFTAPEINELRNSPKKTFAFYFPIFPISIKNSDPIDSYWEEWYNPLGNEDTNPTADMRDRPLFQRPARPEENWRQLDFEVEVKQAIEAGIDGFIYEHNSWSKDRRWGFLSELLAAAQSVDPDFKIVLSPDLHPQNDDPAIIADGLLPYLSHPSVYRDNEGNVLLAPYFAERKPITYWNSVRAILEKAGHSTSLFPIFIHWTGEQINTASGISDLSDWNESIVGYTIWGPGTLNALDAYIPSASEAKRRNRLWMNPIVFEDVRHTENNGRKYYEPSGSATLRKSMETAINVDADMIYYRTWNDYNESWFAPSVERGTTTLDVATYYNIWFKTGSAPDITHDAIYYFHRSQPAHAPFDTSLYTIGGGNLPPIVNGSSYPVENQVELLAFLKEAGTLVISQGSDTQSLEAQAGITSFRVDMIPDQTPEFKLLRESNTVIDIRSHTPIRSQVYHQDMIHHSGGSVAPEC